MQGKSVPAPAARVLARHCLRVDVPPALSCAGYSATGGCTMLSIGTPDTAERVTRRGPQRQDPLQPCQASPFWGLKAERVMGIGALRSASRALRRYAPPRLDELRSGSASRRLEGWSALPLVAPPFTGLGGSCSIPIPRFFVWLRWGLLRSQIKAGAGDGNRTHV